MRFARCLCRARTDAVGVGHLLAGMEASTMPHRKHVSKRKGRKEVVPALGVVGMSLSLAGGASAGTGGPAAVADVPPRTIAPNHEITLNEEEISDVSLGTFYVFDKENAGTPRLGEQYARRGCGGCGCRGCRGCGRGCRGCGCGGCGCGGCGCCLSWGVCRFC
jgi:hypothetical protein